jgi:peptidyl-prolyl cis-trans isomerase B (cyclophilin B)
MYYAGGDDDDYLYRWSQPVYVMSDNAYYFRSGMAPTFGGNYSICVDISGMNCYPYDLGSDYELYEWSIIYRIHNTAGVNYYYTGVLPPDPPDPPILENQTITLEVSYVPWNSTGDGNSSNSGNRIYGTIVIELYPNEAPLHVDSFLTHIQNGAYNNTTFHRVIDGFVIQGGDINNAGGYAAIWYGYCNGQVATPCDTADWTIPSESDNGLTHGPGTLAMARSSNPDSGGSQFYIVPSHSTPSHLDGEYTVFGQVISGQEHVDAISEVEIGPGDEPVYEVRLVHASINE